MIVLGERHSRQVVVEAIRTELDLARQEVLAGRAAYPEAVLVQAVAQRVTANIQPTLQSVINATGVIIHTNLGRALLSRRAQAAMLHAASAYSNLEYDLETGTRGSRYIHAADLLCRLTGAEAALVVNNNAGAVVLALTALVKGAEVLISRGQLVEIGGGFRVPDIMAQSGAALVEVGTTNRTYVHDYERAIRPEQTGMVLSVHHSNYQITGFTTQPTLAELADLAHRYEILLMEDLGSGTLLDTTPYGLAHEPTIQETIAAGVDIVTASGDKLLGGPQAGLIFGKSHLINTIKKHPLTRALRVDKMTLAALQATLLAYLEQKAIEEIPIWQMIAASPTILARRVGRWRRALQKIPGLSNLSIEVAKSVSTVGGGSLPGQTLPTKVLAIAVDSVDSLAEKLRSVKGSPAVIARIENNQLLLDPRTVLPEQDGALVTALKEALLK
jgi:L-seryl-tRNA(Ser) seleniumtransferase